MKEQTQQDQSASSKDEVSSTMTELEAQMRVDKVQAELQAKSSTSQGPWTSEEMDAAEIPEASRKLANWFSDLQDLRESLGLPPQ